MSFNAAFHLDDRASAPAPDLVSSLGISPGTYSSGAITVVDKVLSSALLKSWRWLLGGDAVGLAATAVGDLFFWSEKHRAVFYLETQRGQSTFVDSSSEFFFNEFIVQNGVQESVLRTDFLEALRNKHGKLKYGECYIAEPWLRSGGSGDIATYAKGDLAVYLSLVGQAVEHSMKLERSRTIEY